MKWYKYNIKELDEVEYKKWYRMMSREKQQRVQRFRFEDDKKRTVAGDMLARQAIAKWCNVPEERIVFEKNTYGKPYAKNLPVEFNISHSGNMVVCAVDDKPIGIDIEQIRQIDLSIAKRICREEELVYLFDHIPIEEEFSEKADVELLARFYEIWTLKEAYGKCVGTGLAEGCLMQCTDRYCIEKYIFEEYVMTICTQNN